MSKFVPQLARSILTTCAQTILENSTVAVFLESSVVNAMVGPDVVASQLRTMQVKAPDPTLTLYRQALTVLTGAAAAHGVVGIVLAGNAVAYLAMEGAVELVGAVTIFGCTAAPMAGATGLATEGLMGAIVASVRAALSSRITVAAGAALVAFVIPRASHAAPNIPPRPTSSSRSS